MEASQVKTTSPKGLDLKGLLQTSIKEAGDMVPVIRSSFMRHRFEKFGEVQALSLRLNQQLHQINIALEDNELLSGNLLSIPGHLSQVLVDLEQLGLAVKSKIDENVLFSEKAANELNHLLEKLENVLKDEADALALGNRSLAKLIIEATGDSIKKIDIYGTEHEERLIKGVCSPVSSPIYLRMLDAMKSGFWHIKQIAEHVVPSD